MRIFFKNYHGLTAAHDLNYTISVYLGSNEGRLGVALVERDNTVRFIHVNERQYADHESRWSALLDILDCCVECMEAREDRYAEGSVRCVFSSDD